MNNFTLNRKRISTEAKRNSQTLPEHVQKAQIKRTEQGLLNAAEHQRFGQDTAHFAATQSQADGARRLPDATRHKQHAQPHRICVHQKPIRAGEQQESALFYRLRNVLQRGRRDGDRVARTGQRESRVHLRDLY